MPIKMLYDSREDGWMVSFFASCRAHPRVDGSLCLWRKLSRRPACNIKATNSNKSNLYTFRTKSHWLSKKLDSPFSQFRIMICRRDVSWTLLVAWLESHRLHIVTSVPNKTNNHFLGHLQHFSPLPIYGEKVLHITAFYLKIY